jgi:hypothetical protein
LENDYSAFGHSAFLQHASALGHSAFLAQSVFGHSALGHSAFGHSAFFSQVAASGHSAFGHSAFWQHSVAGLAQHLSWQVLFLQQPIAATAMAAISKIFFITLKKY